MTEMKQIVLLQLCGQLHRSWIC